MPFLNNAEDDKTYYYPMLKYLTANDGNVDSLIQVFKNKEWMFYRSVDLVFGQRKNFFTGKKIIPNKLQLLVLKYLQQWNNADVQKLYDLRRELLWRTPQEYKYFVSDAFAEYTKSKNIIFNMKKFIRLFRKNKKSRKSKKSKKSKKARK